MRRRHSLALVTLLSIVLAALLAACGQTTIAGSVPTSCGTPATGPGPGAGGTASSGTAVAVPGGTVIASPATGTATTPLPSPSGVPIVPNAPQVTPGAAGATGKVTVTVGSQVATLCDTIQVVIANGTSAPVYTTDYQSECSIVTIELQVGSAWQPIGRCMLGRPTRLVQIPAGAAALVRLAPTGTSRFGGGPWAPGAYRVAFSYGAAPDFGGMNSTIYSAQLILSAVS